jgi:multiple sugar transport system permease protein/putative chitobiose transport system permease protein
MKNKNQVRTLALYHIFSILFSFIFVLPILWAMIASFRPEINIFQGISPLSYKVFSFFPFTMDNYFGVFRSEVFSKALLNTFFVATITVLVGVVINAFAGFTFATMNFFGKKVLFAIVISSFLVPADLLVIPTYNLVDSMNLIDTKMALILPMLGNGLVIFMFVQFFSQIPKALSEAAVIDGAGYAQILVIIYAPLTIPTMIGASLIMFIGQWESFLWPLVVSRSVNNGMIQLALSTFTQQYGTLWGLKLAASTVLCFIPLVILMPLQKYYISSIAGSAIKG